MAADTEAVADGRDADMEAAADGRDADGAQEAPPFVHLHVHTHYSLLDGATRIAALIGKCKQFNMPAVAISDHGNLFGAIEFYQRAVKAGVKPIIGCETYLAPFDRKDKSPPLSGMESAYHLLLLAKDLTGYHNLIKLASIGYLEGFYYKPRIDKQVLSELSEGLICTSTCLGGEIPQGLLRKDMAEAKRLAETYLKIFGPDRFFVELQDQGIRKQEGGLTINQAEINAELNELAKRLGVATIATNDVHYLEHDDHEAHDVLCCINTRSLVADEKRFRFETDQFYFKSQAEMAAALPDYPEALANTLHVAEMCNVELDFTKRHAPVYKPPDGKRPDDFLRELVYAGAQERYGEIGDELRERIDYELSVISGKGFSGYFLIVWDFVNYCVEHDIPCSARGSGCSTVVGYCLRLSIVDPLEYGLYFERFMDPERDEMPDIDMDICQDRRQEVINYVRDKYGHVAQIITFGTLKARAAIRDVCRTLGVPLAEADRVAKLVPEELKMTIDKALEREPELKRLYDGEPAIRKVIEIVRRLEGLARHVSVHAAGVVIADVPLNTLIPLYKSADSDDVITQFDGPTVEQVGLLKMDFLGLRTLSQVHLACKLIRQHYDVVIDLEHLDLCDQRVYANLARGETKGVFQFESGGMRDVLMKMRPNRIQDLIAANALFRPGPMEYIDEYVARKHGKPWATPHKLMSEVLEETYGIMVYQEQVSRLVNRLGGVPLRRAFRLAKAISKKKTEMINAEREPFLEGAVANGLDRKTAERVFADILKFGGYAFNKAHSAGYALLAFQTAYLKTYYPVEFMAAVLTYESGSSAKIAEYIQECRRMHQPDGSVGIPINPPDVNESEMAFTVVYDRRQGEEGSGSGERGSGSGERGSGNGDRGSGIGERGSGNGDRGSGRILFGLTAINGLGRKAVQAILDARGDGGRFRDLYDFCERVDLGVVNKGAIESLIKAGAFDRTGAMRRALTEALPGVMEHGQAAQRDRRAGQFSMFGDFGAAPEPPPRTISTAEWSESELLYHEKQALGLYVTKHPLTQHVDLIERFGTARTIDLKKLSADKPVVIGGLISKVRDIAIRSGRSAGKKMAVVLLEDLHGSCEGIVFPDNLERLRPLLKPDTVVFMTGTVDKRREEPCIRVDRLIAASNATRELTSRVLIHLRDGAGEGLSSLRDVCRANRGRCPLYFRVMTGEGWMTTIEADSSLAINPTRECLSGIAEIVGSANVVCMGGTANGRN